MFRDCRLENVEGGLLLFVPFEYDVLFGQGVEWNRDCREVRDEGSVEVAELHKTSNLCEISWGWPFRYRLCLDRVHPEFAIADDHAEEVHLRLFELAFLRFEEQAVLL